MRVDEQLAVREFTPLQDGVDGEVLEELLRHLVQLGLRWRGNHHAEVERVAFELRLHGEGFDLLLRVEGDKHLLRRLEDIGILRGKVAAGGTGGRGKEHEEPDRRQNSQFVTHDRLLHVYVSRSLPARLDSVCRATRERET